MSITQPSSRERFRAYREKVARKWSKRDVVDGTSADIGRVRRQRQRSSMDLLRKFFVLLGDQRPAVIFALTTLTAATLLALIPPAATKLIIDSVLGSEPSPAIVARVLPTGLSRWELLLTISLGVLVLSVVQTGISLWGRWYATAATKRMQLAVRKQVFEHAVRLPLHRVHELKSGGVASILREDAGSVGELIFGMLYNPWRAAIQLLGSLCILAWVDWRLLLGAVLLIPFVFVTHRTWILRIRPLYRDVRARREEIDGGAAEAFGGMRVVRAFSGQRAETTRFVRGNHLLGRQELYVWWWTRIIEVVWDMLIPTASAGLMLYGGYQVLTGVLTLGDLMMFLVYLLMLLEPLAVLAQSATQFQNSLSGLDRVLDVLEEPRELAAAPGKLRVEAPAVAGRIAYHDVGFRYPGTEEPVLEGIDFTAEPGETIALVGPSGAGKTTLCNLVARFYDPTSGTITLDGTDLREIDVENYRKLLGMVEQDVFLFDGTIAENIGYARREATTEEILRAATIAHADEFIERLPEGYETVIGERGVKLSGGQRQRIAIARAVLADPRILILDEATSNLDTESERMIQQGLRQLQQGRTCFVIAHRLSTITHADKILVIEGGRLQEIGSHEDLMTSDGRYRRMVEAQVEMNLGTEGSVSVGS